MANLTATCWTINILPTLTATQAARGGPPERHGYIIGKQRHVRVRMDLNNMGTDLVYPSGGGIPLPTINTTAGGLGDMSWGMRRNIDYIQIYSVKPSVTRGIISDVMWRYCVSEHSIHGYGAQSVSAVGGPTELAELPTSWLPTTEAGHGHSIYANVVGW